MTRDADKIIVPVLPSDIDIHACSSCIRDLLLVAKIRREDNRIGVIANRVRRNTLTYQSLIRFLHTLGIPIVATIRDSQNYVRAAELGVGVHEMKSYVAQDDVEQWAPLVRVAGRCQAGCRMRRPRSRPAAAQGTARDHGGCRRHGQWGGCGSAAAACGGQRNEGVARAAGVPHARASAWGSWRGSRRRSCCRVWPRSRVPGQPSSCSSTRCRGCG